MILPAGANSSLTSLTSVVDSEEKTMKLLADTETRVAQNWQHQHHHPTKHQHDDNPTKNDDESHGSHLGHEEWIQQWVEQGEGLDTSDEDNDEPIHTTEGEKEDKEEPPLVVDSNDKMEQLESIQMVRKMLNVHHKSHRNEEESYCQLGCDGISINSDDDCWSSREEMAQFVASNHSLWTMLSLRLGLSKAHTTQIAAEVAMSLATGYGSSKRNALQQPLSREQFARFQRDVVLSDDPTGAQEFLIGSVFATFDYYKNSKSTASLKNEEELYVFLEILYLVSRVYHCERPESSLDLPIKEELRTSLQKQMENNEKYYGDKELSVEEILQRVTTQTAAAHAKELVVVAPDMRRTRKEVMGWEEEKQQEEFDFCAWLDRLFFGEREEGEERDTLCMRLSRHGSNRGIKRGVQENGIRTCQL